MFGLKDLSATARGATDDAQSAREPLTIAIERVEPELDGGRYPVKREVGELFVVSADIFRHGHDTLRAVLLYRTAGEDEWHEAPMRHYDNDRWTGSFLLEANKRYRYTIEAFVDRFETWRAELMKRVEAGADQARDVASELLVGRDLVLRAGERASGQHRRRLFEAAETLGGYFGPDPSAPRQWASIAGRAEPGTSFSRKRDPIVSDGDVDARLRGHDDVDEAGTEDAHEIWPPDGEGAGRESGRNGRDGRAAAILLAVSAELAALMARCGERSEVCRYDRELEVVVDRPRARFAAWYEMFPRSQGTVPGQSATFADCERRLDEIAAMGFDVVYLPPIHPIGHTKRKGKDNALVAGPDDPGCPYAIGSESGGHKDVDPALGAMADFERFVRRAGELGIEVALDFAIQCSPDHPYVREHPQWFYHRPDGSIRFAENPPKKYEDIFPLDLLCPDREALWQELKSVVLFWVEHGVTTFRVDNPHTKPVGFWQWLIAEVQRERPDVIFLAEAFTRPKMLNLLAKIGFSQSYTYFTWRNGKDELRDYFTELTQGEAAEYLRGNLFTNTPDILPWVLQQGGRPAFKMRLVLAATLSTVYGIYNGFELCENAALPDKEEYCHSEKYEHKVWDWDSPGNIKQLIATVNRIRRENPALRLYRDLRFFNIDGHNLLAYGKMAPDRSNIIIVVVNLDPHQAHWGMLEVPIWEFGIPDGEEYVAHDLVTGARYPWRGARQYIRLDPEIEPAHIFRLERGSNQ